ncbi:hypothetical protein Mal35_20780 [Gimesia maris]|nr:hypothetical protein Mal35_20780 [Gimesia maris]
MSHTAHSYTIDADALLRATGKNFTQVEWDLRGALCVSPPKTASQLARVPSKCEDGQEKQGLNAPQFPQKNLEERTHRLRQVLSDPVHKVAHSEYRRNEFRLKNGVQVSPHPAPRTVKIALSSPFVQAPPQQNAMVPVVTAQQQMQQFMPAQTPVLGQGVRPTGLDGPNDTRATALPGTPGHAATNVIDQQGGLDPRGQTVDGNNAAGVPIRTIASCHNQYLSGKVLSTSRPRRKFRTGICTHAAGDRRCDPTGYPRVGPPHLRMGRL